MSIERFTKRAGDSVLQGEDDPLMLLFGDVVPDTVRLPDELGGHTVRVTGAHAVPCPSPSCPDHQVRHLTLSNGLGVAECATAGFLWYRPRS